MNSVQENKNELEAAVRYCESAISRAQATIESMEFRQQAASKAWHEQTGREAALEHAVNDLKKRTYRARGQVGRAQSEIAPQANSHIHNDRLMISTKEVGDLQSEVDELAKAYKDSTHEEVTMKKAWREQQELVALRDDQIAMLERRLAKSTGEKAYPFKEGDLYYVFNNSTAHGLSRSGTMSQSASTTALTSRSPTQGVLHGRSEERARQIQTRR